MTESQSHHVPPGGSATINGVLYQLLWSLLRAARVRFVGTPEWDGDEIQSVTILLEPEGGGGDLVVENPKKRVVEQLKVRPSGKSWSLREIVESVLPDLYLGHDGDASETEYRFVTEGRMGKWSSVDGFFRKLAVRPFPEDDPLSGLDETTELKFSRKKTAASGKSKKAEKPFWDLPTYTERTMFERIVSEVRKRKAVRDTEDEITTQRRLRKVLGHFEFVGGQTMVAVQEEIDSHLAAVVDVNDEISKIRDSLAMELARRATEGDAVVECSTFFSEQGLRAIPLTQWGALRAAAHQYSEAVLLNLGYDNALDVRYQIANRLIKDWPTSACVIGVAGESGSGKSWTLFGASHSSQNQKPLSVVIEAAGTTDAILERAATAIWSEIAGHDQSIPLSQIGQRVQQLLGRSCTPWFTLIIDGTVSDAVLRELIRKPWEQWGVRVLLSVPCALATELERSSRGRFQFVTVGDFSTAELHTYLERIAGPAWTDIPEFVRVVLRKPLLAGIYHQIISSKENTNWYPQSEYEVLSAFWDRMQRQNPMDRLLLVNLANAYLVHPAEQFSDSQVQRLQGTAETLRRLEGAGWVQLSYRPSGMFVQFSHQRLLNWACAQALVAKYQDGDLDCPSLGEKLRELLYGTSELYRYTLSFVPMDCLWLLCSDPELTNHVPKIIAELEVPSHLHTEQLYEKLLPTIGAPVLDALGVQLRHNLSNDYLSQTIATAIGRIGGNRAIQLGLQMLRSEVPLLRRAAATIFAICPSAEVLDELWRLHLDCLNEPSSFLREHERQSSYLLRDKAFSALKECSRLSLNWLNQAISGVQSSSQIVSDLAYLVANIPGEPGRILWETNREALFQKVPPDRQKCLATCIDKHSDRELIPWLVENIEQTDDWLGIRAFSALARLDPLQAIENLDRIPKHERAMARGWYIDYLFAVAPDAFRTKLLANLDADSDLWDAADVFRGRTHFIDIPILDLLLNDLEGRLSELLAPPQLEGEDRLHRPLSFLATINTAALVDHLASYRGSQLESLLSQLVLRIGPRVGLSRDSFIRDEAVQLLHRINGGGFTTALNSLLRAESRYGRWDGLQIASLKQDDDTYSALADITRHEKTGESSFSDQCDAAKILAEHGIWEPVIALIRRIGMNASTGITRLPRWRTRPPAELLTGLATKFSANPEAAAPGDVLALGFGASNNVELVRCIGDLSDPQSELAHACVVALDMLSDKSELSVPFLARQLRVQRSNFSATNALIANGTQAALQALSNHAGDHLSGAVAVNLMTRLDDPADAVVRTRETIVRSIQSGRRWRLASEIDSMIDMIDNPDLITQILDDRSIEQYLREEAFADEGNCWATGSKADAIRTLQHIDPRTAFLAAKVALQNSEAHDREFYPSLLSELDSAMAAPLLLEILEHEEADSVRKAIGRTIAQIDIEELILKRSDSSSPSERRAACYAAGWAKLIPALKSKLLLCINDQDQTVAQSAASALTLISVREDCQELAKRIFDAPSEDARWLYLNCLVSLADPGDNHHQWPIDGTAIGEVLTPFQRKWAMKQLEDLRKKDK